MEFSTFKTVGDPEESIATKVCSTVCFWSMLAYRSDVNQSLPVRIKGEVRGDKVIGEVISNRFLREGQR